MLGLEVNSQRVNCGAIWRSEEKSRTRNFPWQLTILALTSSSCKGPWKESISTEVGARGKKSKALRLYVDMLGTLGVATRWRR